MDFFDTTTKFGLCQDVDFLVGSDTDNYPLADKARSANKAVRKVATWIWRAVPDWEFDDSNFTTLPIATRDLVDDQEDYALPTNVFGVDRAEVLDINGDWIKLIPMDKSQISVAYPEFEETKGIPKFYDMVGNSIITKPAPDVTKVTETNGLRLYLSRSTDTFASTDTTKEPGFNPMFHSIVSILMALDYAIKNVLTEKVIILKRMLYGDPNVKNDTGEKDDLQDHYAQRHNRGFKPRIRPKRRSSI